MKRQWVEIAYHDGENLHFAYGTIQGTLDECILAKGSDEWVRLDDVRWLNESGTAMEKLEDDLVGTEGYFYIRASSIVRVAPIRKDVDFWNKGEPPLRAFVESTENN